MWVIHSTPDEYEISSGSDCASPRTTNEAKWAQQKQKSKNKKKKSTIKYEPETILCNREFDL